MTRHEIISPAPVAAAGPGLWRAELAETVRLSVPMALSQLGQVAMITTDLALLGRLGAQTVAAAALAHTVLFGAFVLGFGFVSAVAPLAAQAHGAREPRQVRRSLRVGIWAAVIVGVPLTAVQLTGEPILRALGQDAEGAALAGRYLLGLGWSLIPTWIFMALRAFMGAVGRPEPALWITIAAIPLNAAIAYGLINGALGLPRLEILGAGLATAIVNVLMALAAAYVVTAWRPYRKYRPLGRLWRLDAPLLAKLFALGIPISGTFALEYGLFAAAALMIGWFGTTALAAHQIALQIASILFMVPFGISQAATVRVGHAVGRGDGPGQRRAGLVAIGLAAAFMAAMTLIVIAARDILPTVFVIPDTEEARATIALTGALLLLGATFFVCDGIQTVAVGALRGLGDFRVPLVIAAVSFWVVGLGSAWLLGLTLGGGTRGIWIAMSVSIAVYAGALVWRFLVLTDPRSGRAPVARL